MTAVSLPAAAEGEDVYFAESDDEEGDDEEGVGEEGDRDDEQPAEVEFQAAPELLDEGPPPAKTAPAKERQSAESARWARMRSTKRPGDQDILTSPLVLGLGGLALCLLLAAGAIWLLIGRERANELYEAAVADRQSGRYS